MVTDIPVRQVISKWIDTTGYTVRFAGIAQVLYTGAVKAIRKAARITACQSDFLQRWNKKLDRFLRRDCDADSATRAR